MSEPRMPEQDERGSWTAYPCPTDNDVYCHDCAAHAAWFVERPDAWRERRSPPVPVICGGCGKNFLAEVFDWG